MARSFIASPRSARKQAALHAAGENALALRAGRLGDFRHARNVMARGATRRAMPANQISPV